MDFRDIENKMVALIVWNTDKDDDMQVFVGQIFKEETKYIFKNESKGWTVHVDTDRLENIRKVTDELKETLLNADYFVNLTIGDLTDNNGQFIPTGMKWHP